MATTPADPPADAAGGVTPSWFDKPGPHATAQTAPAGHAPAPVLDAHLIGRTSIGLIVVIVIILACGYLLKRFGPYRGQRAGLMKIIAARSLGSRERIVVVEVDDRWLVLGVTPQHISHLHTMEPREDEPSAAADAADSARPTFRQALAANLSRSRSGRRS